MVLIGHLTGNPGHAAVPPAVRLAITAIPKITLTPETGKPTKSFFPSLLIFLGFLLIF
jgi:hypothetical protein